MRAAQPLLPLLLLALLAPAASAGEWPQFRADPLHTGAGSGAFGPPLDLWWRVPAGAPIEGSPVVVDGRVIVGSSDGKLHAFDALTGKALWTFAVQGPITGTPAVAGGVVYLVSDAGELFAIDATTGKVRNHAPYGNPSPGAALTNPSIHEGRLYVGTEGGAMLAYNLQTLTVDWEYRTADERSRASADAPCTGRFAAKPVRSSPAVYDDKVLFGSDVHGLFAIEEFGLGGLLAGTTKGAWVDAGLTACEGLPPPAKVPQFGNVVRASPALDAQSGTVVVPSYDNTVRAFNLADGSQRWNVTVAMSGRDARVVSSPAVADGVVYFGSFNRRFYAFEALNETPYVREKWNVTVGDAIWSSPAVAGGHVAFGADDETVYVLEAATGKEVWRHKTGGDIRSSPAIVDGVLYVGSSDGFLYAFGGAKPMTPDLAVTQLDWDRALYVADVPTTVRFEVTNRGNLSAPPNEVLLHIDDALATTQPVRALGPGESLSFAYEWVVPQGNHTLRAVVDPAWLSREFDRANNERVVEAPVAMPPPPAEVEEVAAAPPPPPPPAKFLGVPGPGPLLAAVAWAVAALARRR